MLVVKEIDNGLHPSRAHHLIRTLKSLGKERSVDIVCTTHNPAMLDALGNEMLPFISVAHRDAHGASTITLLEQINDLPKLMAFGSIGDLNTSGEIEEALTGKSYEKSTGH